MLWMWMWRDSHLGNASQGLLDTFGVSGSKEAFQNTTRGIKVAAALLLGFYGKEKALQKLHLKCIMLGNVSIS